MVFCYGSFSTFCCCSVVKWCLTLCNCMDCSRPAFPVPHHLPEFAQTLVHWVGDAIQPSQPLSSPSLSAFHLSHHQGLLQWAGSSSKYWHFSFSTSPPNGYSGLFSFRIDWFNLRAVQGTLESYPETQFESINSMALGLLYVPALIICTRLPEKP